LVDKMMDEVVRSTPSSAPMRSMTHLIHRGGGCHRNQVHFAADRVQDPHLRDAAKRSRHRARFLGADFDHDVRTHRSQAVLGREAHAIAHDDPLLLQALDAALHAGARATDQPGELRSRSTSVLA
jgi:hypothetical protein